MAVVVVGNPLSHLDGIERGLRDEGDDAAESGGFARDRVGTLGLGLVGMEGEPEDVEASCGTPAAADAGFVDVPFGGFASDELERAGGVVEAGFDGRMDLLSYGVRDEPVVDGDDGNAGFEALVEEIGIGFVAVHPAAAVDEKHEGRGLVVLSFGTVEVENLGGMGTVGDVGFRGDGNGSLGVAGGVCK